MGWCVGMGRRHLASGAGPSRLRPGERWILYPPPADVKGTNAVDLAFIERLMQMFERSSLAELEYGEASGRVRLARGQAGLSNVPAATAEPPPPQAAACRAEPARHVVQASFPGVFYRSAAPGQPPLVSVGDVVEEGQTLGILEAMKLFNRVQADMAGRVVEIPVEDGATVELGATLFVLEASGQPA